MLQPKERARRKLRARSFPPEWQGTLEQTVPLYRRMPADDRVELHGHMQVLAVEKRWEGASGLVVTEAMRWVILSQAALLLLHRPPRYYPRLSSIVIYPDEYAVVEEIDTEDGLVAEIREQRVGESWGTGALILSWADVGRDLKDSHQNVVLHEFAHQLDLESGHMNGAPPLGTRSLRERWPAVMGRAFERLAAAADRQEGTLLDSYGAEDPAEFFAVAVEAFFLIPHDLKRQEPDLYSLLRDYFLQDPAHWPNIR